MAKRRPIDTRIGGGTFNIAVDGVAGPTTAGTMAASAVPLRLGGKTGSSGGGDFTGAKPSFAIFDRKLAAADRQTIRRHLSDRYRIPLS